MTTAEYFTTPVSVVPHELIYGELRVGESPAPPHQAAVADFHLALAPFVRARRLGEIWLAPLDVVLDEAGGLVVQPDLLFISHERAGIVTDRVRGAPDMVLEVLSPRPRIGAFDERLGWFARSGVQECWVLRLGLQRLDILSCDGQDVIRRDTFDRQTPIRSRLLPGFDLALDAILRRPAF